MSEYKPLNKHVFVKVLETKSDSVIQQKPEKHKQRKDFEICEVTAISPQHSEIFVIGDIIVVHGHSVQEFVTLDGEKIQFVTMSAVVGWQKV